MKPLICLSALLFAPLWLHAQETAPAIDPDLPQPIDLTFADSLLVESPFNRSVNLEETLELTGVAYIDGRPVATVLNKETKQRIVVTEVPNSLGWQLMGAVAGADLANTEVQIMVGTERVTMHYGGAQMRPGGDAAGTGTTRLAGKNSPPSPGGKLKASSYLGEHGKELYTSLSPSGRDKFRDLMKNYLEKRPGISAEKSSDYARKVFARIQAADSPAKSSKTSKTKKKQGA